MRMRRFALAFILAVFMLGMVAVPALAATTGIDRTVDPSWRQCTPLVSHHAGTVTIRVTEKPGGTVYTCLRNSSGQQVGPTLTWTSTGTKMIYIGTTIFAVHARTAGSSGRLAGFVTY